MTEIPNIILEPETLLISQYHFPVETPIVAKLKLQLGLPEDVTIFKLPSLNVEAG
jgi:hypothetical protein